MLAVRLPAAEEGVVTEQLSLAVVGSVRSMSAVTPAGADQTPWRGSMYRCRRSDRSTKQLPPRLPSFTGLFCILGTFSFHPKSEKEFT